MEPTRHAEASANSKIFRIGGEGEHTNRLQNIHSDATRRNPSQWPAAMHKDAQGSPGEPMEAQGSPRKPKGAASFSGFFSGLFQGVFSIQFIHIPYVKHHKCDSGTAVPSFSPTNTSTTSAASFDCSTSRTWRWARFSPRDPTTRWRRTE